MPASSARRATSRIFCRMLLDGGAVGPTRVLSPLAVERMTSPASPAARPTCAVWAGTWTRRTRRIAASFCRSARSAIRASRALRSGSIPASRVFVVFLSNRVHPDGRGDVTPLRARVASVVASSLTGVVAGRRAAKPSGRGRRSTPQSPAVPPATGAAGADAASTCCARTASRELKGLSVGLVTNHTGRARDGATTIDLLAAAPGVKLVALFSPEHGIRGILDSSVPSSVDEKTESDRSTRCTAATQRPTPEMLNGIDAMVIDLQDIGARFYTYMTTMAYVMEEAAWRKIRVIVLDRPNPIGGVQIEGPALDQTALGFTGYITQMPIRPALTHGRAGAAVQRRRRKIGADLTVVAMTQLASRRLVRRDRAAVGEPVAEHADDERGHAVSGHRRVREHEPVGRPRHRHAVRAHRRAVDQRPGAGGDAERAADSRHPLLSCHASRRCRAGSRRKSVRACSCSSPTASAVRPVRVGVEIASALLQLFPGRLEIDAAGRLFGSTDGIARLKAGEDPAAIAASWSAAEARWRLLRAKYL